MTKIAEDIAEIKTDMKWVKRTLSTHMSHHFKVRLTMLGSLVVAIVALLIAIL